MRVFVYFNLHRKLWSIKALEGPERGRVIGHAQAVLLDGPTARVSEAGRQRVLRERKKNVHAGLVGRLVAVDHESPLHARFPKYGRSWLIQGGARITYNPYKYSTFVMAEADHLAFVSGEEAVLLGDRSVRVWGATTERLDDFNQLPLEFAA